jgi:hypothetical protein
MSLSTSHLSDASPDAADRRIREDLEATVRHHAAQPERIPARLEELAAEWDVERTLITNASTLMLTGLVLGTFVDRRWLALPGVVGTFLLQHGLQGWCPPLPLFRLLGVRTKEEILEERYALRALQGELEGLAEAAEGAPPERARRVLAALGE